MEKYYKQLLDLSWEYLNEELKLIMKNLKLLPVETPIDLDKYLPNINNKRNKIEELVNRGFLEWEKYGESIVLQRIIKDYLLCIE